MTIPGNNLQDNCDHTPAGDDALLEYFDNFGLGNEISLLNLRCDQAAARIREQAAEIEMLRPMKQTELAAVVVVKRERDGLRAEVERLKAKEARVTEKEFDTARRERDEAISERDSWEMRCQAAWKAELAWKECALFYATADEKADTNARPMAVLVKARLKFAALASLDNGK